MFDLKDKLMALGVVTKEQVDRVTQTKKQRPEIAPKNDVDFDRQKAQNQLLSLPKNEQYILIRKWVDINRLDKGTPDMSEKFFFDGGDQVAWLSVSPTVSDKIAKGEAGVISYFSNHGLAHAVVPRDIAEDVALVFPQWQRVLNPKT
jgi:hypothetical protein